MAPLVHRFRTLLWTAFYHSIGRLVFTEIGRGARFEGWVDVPQAGGSIRIGRGVRICRGVELTVGRGAELRIGDRAFIGRGVVLSAHVRIEIGAGTLIGEYVCIHDNDHVTADPSLDIADQGFSAEPLRIGAHCWLGAHCVVVKGAGLGARCVAGAGAVVTRKIPDGAVVLGVPARPVREGAPKMPREPFP
jgi:acetyltransferase-like isoleucine patch superfamily enzyme